MLEKFETNEYLPHFYEEMKKVGSKAYNKYAYPTQMVFFNSRVEREAICDEQDKVYIIDRSIPEDRYIFAENIHRNNLITCEEYEQYQAAYDSSISKMRPLDVLIYLRAGLPTLVERIKSRGRQLESEIDQVYLGDLNELYETKFLPEVMKDEKIGKVFVFDVNEMDAESVADECITKVTTYLNEIGKSIN